MRLSPQTTLLLLALMLPASRCALPSEIHDVSPLDDHSDPLWLDRASHHGTIEAEKDIAQAEKESRRGLHNTIETDLVDRQRAASEANDQVKFATDAYSTAHQKRKELEHVAGLAAVRKDGVEDKLIEDGVRTNADISAQSERKYLSDQGAHIQDRYDESRTEEMQNQFQDLTVTHQHADDAAWHAAEKEHSAHMKLKAARQARDISAEMAAATAVDERQARNAVSLINSDVVGATQRAKERAVKKGPPQSDGNYPGYIVDGDTMYRARFSPNPPPPAVGALNKVEREAQTVVSSEKKVEQQGSEWVYKTAERHHMKPLESLKQKEESPFDDQLGESEHTAPTVFKFSQGSAIKAINEVSNMATRISDAAERTIASGSDDAQGDSDLLKSIKSLSFMRERAYNSSKLARDIAESDAAFKNSKRAVDAVINPPLTTSGRPLPEGCGAAETHVKAAYARMKAMQEKIKALTAKLEKQEIVAHKQTSELTILRIKCGPLAAEHEAADWMKKLEKKNKDEAFSFDSAVMKGTQKTKQKTLQKQTAVAWSNAVERAAEVNRDLTDATNTEHSAIEKYEDTTVRTADADETAKRMQNELDDSLANFKSFGPKQSEREIQGSEVAKKKDILRTDAKNRYDDARRGTSGAAKNSQIALNAERAASLDMLKAFKAKSAAFKTYSDARLKSAEAKCGAEKALGGQCHDVGQLLDLNVKHFGCTNFTTWKTGIAKSTLHIDMLKTKQKYENEHEQLHRCRHSNLIPCGEVAFQCTANATNSTNATANATNSTDGTTRYLDQGLSY